MIGQQGPSIDWGLRLCGKITQPGDKVLPVLVVIHDPGNSLVFPKSFKISILPPPKLSRVFFNFNSRRSFLL